MLIPEITAPALDAVLSLKTSVQKNFDTDPHRLEPHDSDPTPNRVDETMPDSVSIAWKEAVKAEILLSETESFDTFKSFYGRGSVRIFNLLPGRTYFYKLLYNGKYSETRKFAIANELPRQIYLPELTNVRDCGGWLLDNGKRRKFNMIFRGGQLEPWTGLPHGSSLNAQGEKAWIDLKIKTDLDLRGDGEAVLPEEITSYKKLPSTAYATWQETGIFSPQTMAQTRKIFEFFSDETVYPVYMHCAGGGDRTGTIAFLLGAMLGMGYDDLITDYEYSNLSVSGERCRHSKVWRAFEEKLKEFAPGEPVKTQVINYLHACGISSDTLAKIADILTE